MPIDYKNIARLKMKEVSNRKITDSLSISRNNVNRCIKIIEASNLNYAEILEMNDVELKKLFNKDPGSKKQETYVVPDFEHLTKELAKPGVTMQLLWGNRWMTAKETWMSIHSVQKVFQRIFIYWART